MLEERVARAVGPVKPAAALSDEHLGDQLSPAISTHLSARYAITLDDPIAARLVAGYGFADFAGQPVLPDDLAERLQADLDYARRAGGCR